MVNLVQYFRLERGIYRDLLPCKCGTGLRIREWGLENFSRLRYSFGMGSVSTNQGYSDLGLTITVMQKMPEIPLHNHISHGKQVVILTTLTLANVVSWR